MSFVRLPYRWCFRPWAAEDWDIGMEDFGLEDGSSSNIIALSYTFVDPLVRDARSLYSSDDPSDDSFPSSEGGLMRSDILTSPMHLYMIPRRRNIPGTLPTTGLAIRSYSPVNEKVHRRREEVQELPADIKPHKKVPIQEANQGRRRWMGWSV